jgi:hypothetical protein
MYLHYDDDNDFNAKLAGVQRVHNRTPAAAYV